MQRGALFVGITYHKERQQWVSPHFPPLTFYIFKFMKDIIRKSFAYLKKNKKRLLAKFCDGEFTGLSDNMSTKIHQTFVFRRLYRDDVGMML